MPTGDIYAATTGGTWLAWNDYSQTTSVTQPTWSQWIETSTRATTTTWAAWSSSQGYGYAQGLGQPQPYQGSELQQPPQGYEAQRARLEQIDRENILMMGRARAECAMEEERVKREAAERRALELLEANLALEERERLQRDGHFIVYGRSGCRYRIRRGRSGNVDVVDKKGVITHRLCAHPADYIPDSDTMLAQKLMLEHDEAGFIKIANRHPTERPNAQVLPALN